MKILSYATVFSLLMTLTSLSSAAPQGMPTPAAKPLPTLHETQNIDTVLTEKTQAAIRRVPLLKNQAISAGSSAQVIVLQGSVDNETQENAAIKAAKSVKGVKKVESQLTVRHKHN